MRYKYVGIPWEAFVACAIKQESPGYLSNDKINGKHLKEWMSRVDELCVRGGKFVGKIHHKAGDYALYEVPVLLEPPTKHTNNEVSDFFGYSNMTTPPWQTGDKNDD